VSLEQITKKIKSMMVTTVLYRISIFLAVLLISADFIGLFLLKENKKPDEIKIIKNFSADIFIKKNQNEKGNGEIIASKNGTKYYFPHCSGVKRIKNENRVYFLTVDAAETAGYVVASNCK
jgi:hypothetical protein